MPISEDPAQEASGPGPAGVEPPSAPQFTWELESLEQRLRARGTLGGYELLERLGQGGMGLVFRARDPDLGREVALKVMLHPTEAAAERFAREARLTAGLDHPGVVRVHDAGVDDGFPYIVYELIEGAQSLERVLSARGRRERCALVAEAGRAVGAAHASGIVHRDLKPENMLVDGNGRLRVLDFGVAVRPGEERLTKTGQLIGTPFFMSPEQIVNAKRAGPPADVWALGVVLYQALTDQLPFEAVTLAELMARLQQAVEPPRRIDPTIDRRIEAVCLRALERDVAARYPNGDAFAQALEDALAEPTQDSPWGLRALVAGAGAAALVVILTAISFTRGQTSPPPTQARIGAQGEPAAAEVAPPIADRLLVAASTPRWAVWVDARRVVTGGPDDDVRLWDAATGQQTRTWKRRATTAVSCGPGRLALASDVGLSLLHVDAASKRPTSLGRFAGVRHVAYAAQADSLAVIARAGSEEWGVFLVSTDGTRRAVRLPRGSNALMSVGLSADGKTVVAGDRAEAGPNPESVLSVGGTALIAREEEGLFRLDGSVLLPSFARVHAFNPKSHTLVMGTAGGHVPLIPAGGRDIMGHFHTPDVGASGSRAHFGPVHGLAFSPDGLLLYSLAETEEASEVRTWEIESGSLRPPVIELQGRPYSLALSPNGAALVIGTRDHGVLVRAVAR